MINTKLSNGPGTENRVEKAQGKYKFPLVTDSATAFHSVAGRFESAGRNQPGMAE